MTEKQVNQEEDNYLGDFAKAFFGLELRDAREVEFMSGTAENGMRKKAEEYAEKLIEHKMANHDNFVKEKAKEEIVNVYIAGYNEAKKGFQAEMEYAETHCFFSDDCTQIENLKKAKELLRRVIEWGDWQSGSKCPSFKEIEKDIKTFLE